MGTRQANLTSSDRPVELVYKGIKQEIEELKATAIEWTNNLKRLIPDKGGEG